MSEQIMLAELVSQAKPKPCVSPFILLAYWPPGGWWKVQPGMYSAPDEARILAEIFRLRNKGWSNITILKLPV